MQLSEGHISGLFSEPIALVVYVIVALVLVWPLVVRMARRSPGEQPESPIETREKVDAG